MAIGKWNKAQLNDFLEEERFNCYWFWFKGKITRKRNKETGEIYEQNLSSKCEWNGQRLKNGFFNIFQQIENMAGVYNGQTKQEYQKNFTRVRDIVSKSEGDIDKAVRLAKTQATRITDEWKAINRAMAARQSSYVSKKEQEIYESIFEVFFQRAYELGTVSKQDYREYKLSKLGI